MLFSLKAKWETYLHFKSLIVHAISSGVGFIFQSIGFRWKTEELFTTVYSSIIWQRGFNSNTEISQKLCFYVLCEIKEP